MSGEEGTTPARKPYTRDEDLEILHYIIKNDSFTKVKGIAFWVEMAKALGKKVSNRSSQSLKERFRKVIIRDIASYELGDKATSSLLDPFRAVEIKQPLKNVTVTRHPYTFAEDVTLASFVLKNPNSDAKGNVLWMKLENTKLLQGRSWMSMRNRFATHVRHNLNAFLSASDALAVQRIIRGDLSCVDDSSKEDDYPRDAKNRKTRLRAEKERRIFTLKSRADAEPPLPSTSRRHRPPQTTSYDDSDSDASGPPQRKRTLRVIESESEGEQLSDPKEGNGADSSVKETRAVVERCDVDLEHSESTYLNATNVGLNRNCCSGLDSTSSSCTLVGPRAPFSVLAAEAVLRADPTTPPDLTTREDSFAELTLAETVKESQEVKHGQAVPNSLGQTRQTDESSTQDSSVSFVGNQQCTGVSRQEPASQSFKYPKHALGVRRCLDVPLESEKSSFISLESGQSIVVKSGSGTVVDDRCPGQTAPAKEVLLRTKDLGMLGEDSDLFDENDESGVFYDPLTRGPFNNFASVDGSTVNFGSPTFPVLYFL